MEEETNNLFVILKEIHFTLPSIKHCPVRQLKCTQNSVYYMPFFLAPVEGWWPLAA